MYLGIPNAWAKSSFLSMHHFLTPQIWFFLDIPTGVSGMENYYLFVCERCVPSTRIANRSATNHTL